MNIKIIAALVLFSFPGGLIIAGLVPVFNKIIKGGNMKKLINSIKALCSLVFAEEFSLDCVNIHDRAEIAYAYSN